MKKNEIIELVVSRIWLNGISKYARIKVKHNEIIWMNTNVLKSGKELKFAIPGDKCRQSLIIESISQNLIDEHDNKISHKIKLIPPNDYDCLYTYITDKQLIQLGYKEKHKSIFKVIYDISLKFYRLVLSVIGILALTLGVITDGFGLLDRKKTNQPTKEHTTKTDTLLKSDQYMSLSDSTSISKNDSLQ